MVHLECTLVCQRNEMDSDIKSAQTDMLIIWNVNNKNSAFICLGLFECVTLIPSVSLGSVVGITSLIPDKIVCMTWDKVAYTFRNF